MARTHFSGPVYSANGFIGALTVPAGSFNTANAQTGITAGTTQTQAGATALTGQINNISTVTTAGDGVRLPTSVAGRIVWIINPTANSVQVYGASTDTINAVATGTGVAQAAGKTAAYVCAVAGAWYRLLSA